jgi:hypothetical protein
VEWRTGLERDTLGFNIYRIKNGERTQLNPGLIAGSALIVRGGSQAYSWFDKQGTIGCVYEVEIINLKGESAANISAAAIWQTVLPDFQQAELLSQLGASSRPSTAQADWSEADDAKDNSLTAASFAGESLAEQWTIANQPALKIGVRADGWYRVTQTQMAAAGFDTSAPAQNLRLFAGGNEVAIRVSRDNGALASGDFIEFWGQGLDTSTTDTQVYWLVNGAQAGLRIATKGELRPDVPPAKPVPTLTQSVTSTAANTNRTFWNLSLAGDVGRVVLQNDSERRESTQPQAKAESRSSGPTLSVPDASESKSTAPKEGTSESSSVSASPVRPEKTKPNPTAIKATIAASQPLKPPPTLKARATRASLRSAKTRARRNRSRPKRRRSHHTGAPAARVATFADTAPAFTYSLQRQDHNIYYSAALNGERDNFFGPVIFGDGPIVTLTLRNIETTSLAPAQLQVNLQGVSFETHHVRVFDFFGQYRIDHIHVAQDFEQIADRRRFADGMKNLDDPVEQIQRQRLVMLRQ